MMAHGSGSLAWKCRSCGSRAKRATCSHPAGRFYVVVRVGKKQKWIKSSKLKKQADRHLTEVLGQLYSGTFKELPSVTFQEFSEKWLKDYAIPHTKHSTYETYVSIIDKRLAPAFGRRLLASITTSDIQSFVSSLLQKSRLSPKSTNNSLILLKTMFRHALEWGYLRQDPCKPVKRLKLEQKEMDFLTAEEVRLLLKHSDEPYRTLFLCAVLTGMRMGEVLSLMWGDVDWANDRILVKRSLFWRAKKNVKESAPTWEFTTPKSSYSKRSVPMGPRLREALQVHKITSREHELDLVFCTGLGNPLDPSTVLSRGLRPALARAGLRQLRFHDLRHTCASLLLHQGESVKAVQQQLGHASASTTLNVYTHVMPSVHNGIGVRIDEQVFGPSDANGSNRVLTKQAQRSTNNSNRQQDLSTFTPTHSKR